MEILAKLCMAVAEGKKGGGADGKKNATPKKDKDDKTVSAKKRKIDSDGKGHKEDDKNSTQASRQAVDTSSDSDSDSSSSSEEEMKRKVRSSRRCIFLAFSPAHFDHFCLSCITLEKMS